MALCSVLFFLAASLPLPALAFSPATPKVDWGKLTVHHLTAAPTTPSIETRDSSFDLCLSTSIRYVSLSQTAPAVDVHVSSDIPFLDLESNNHHFQSVACDGSTIRLEFMSQHVFATAKSRLSQLTKSYAVTSHNGCNADGAPTAYYISDVSFDILHSSAYLKSTPIGMTEAFPSHKVSFDYTAEPAAALSDVQRRDTSTSPTKSFLPSNALNHTAFSAGSANITQLNKTESNTYTADLNHGLIDHSLQIPLGQGPDVPLNIKCKNCSTFGTMTLTRLDFDFDFDAPTAETTLPFEGGISLRMDDFSAIVELENEVSETWSHTFELFSLPIVGYNLPGFGIVGLFLDVPLQVEFALAGGLSFTYGFTIHMPSNSTVFVDFSNLNASYVKGFDEASIKALPFQANLTALHFKATIALQPTISIGFDLESQFMKDHAKAKAEAGVFFNLPSVTIDATILDAPEACSLASTLSNSTFNDEPTSDGQKQDDAADAFLAQLGNVTHIVPSVEVDVGVVAGAEVNFGKKKYETDFPHMLFSKTMPTMATACMAYDSKASKLAPATEVLASITSAAAASSASSLAASKARVSTSTAEPAKKPADEKGAAARLTPGVSVLFGVCLMLGTTLLSCL